MHGSCDVKEHIYKSITGSWSCEEYNPIYGQRVYIVDIERSKLDSTQFLLMNFHNLDINEFIYAYQSDSVLTIPEQPIVSLFVKDGKGIVSGDFKLITLNYEIFDGINDVKIHAIYSRPD